MDRSDNRSGLHVLEYLCENCSKVTKTLLKVDQISCSCGGTARFSGKGVVPTDVNAVSEATKARRREMCYACPYNYGGCCSYLPPGRNLIENGVQRKSVSCPIGNWAGEFVRGKVGFVSVSYMQVGGVETWHRTLLPRMGGVAGFVSLEGELTTGDPESLGCPVGVGMKAAKQLAKVVDVLVVWGIGKKLGEVVQDASCKVVSVSHCDDKSDWTIKLMQDQAPWTDHCVYICGSGRNTCPPFLPSTYIPNAADPARVKPKVTEPSQKTILLCVSRISPEKRIDLLVRAIPFLPRNYELWIAGKSSGWSQGYCNQMKEIACERVKFLGPVDNPAELYSKADIYLSASEYEGYGLSTAEAILAGLPVVSTPVGFLEGEKNTLPHNANLADWVGAILRGGWKFKPKHTLRDFVGGWEKLCENLLSAK